MSEGLGYFAAVYRDGRVHIGNKSYAAGVYAVHLLNQYYKNDTAARIAVYKQYILQVRRQLILKKQERKFKVYWRRSRNLNPLIL